MIKRYGFGREHANRVGCPGIIELPDGEYVRHADYLAELNELQAELAEVERIVVAQTVTIAEMRAARGPTCKTTEPAMGKSRGGRKLATTKPAYKLPFGVSIRTLKSGDLLQIAFTYRGQQCRELLPEKKITKAYVDYAGGLRAEVTRKIADDVFNYSSYFPNSPKATKFAPERKWVLIGDLLRNQLSFYDQQVANDTLSSSTLLSYTKIINGKLIPKWGDTAINDLAPSMLREWIGQMGVTAKTVRNTLSPLRSVLDDAVNDELLELNPLDRAALSKIIRQTSKKSEYDVDPFDCDETAAGIRDIELSAKAVEALQAQKPVSFLANGRVWLNPRTNDPWAIDSQIRKRYGNRYAGAPGYDTEIRIKCGTLTPAPC